MTIYEFMSDSPFLTFFIAYFIFRLSVLFYKVPFMALNIFKHGYPPKHCDAVGKLKDEEDEG